jgi:hypothetical protein
VARHTVVVTADDDGDYSATIPANTVDPDYDIAVTFLAETEFGRVVTDDVSELEYQHTEYAEDVAPGSNVDVDWTATNDEGPDTAAFGVLDSVTTAGRAADSAGIGLTSLDIHFPGAGDDDDSYSNSGGLYIGDRDWADWDVIDHEYGHRVAHDLGIDDSPGGNHCLENNVSVYICPDNGVPVEPLGLEDGAKLAWSEGWANFYAEAAQESDGSAPAIANIADGRYVDTPLTTDMTDSLDSGYGFGYENEEESSQLDPPPFDVAANFVYQADDNEVAMARWLYDLFDTGGFDIDDDVEDSHLSIEEMADIFSAVGAVNLQGADAGIFNADLYSDVSSTEAHIVNLGSNCSLQEQGVSPGGIWGVRPGFNSSVDRLQDDESPGASRSLRETRGPTPVKTRNCSRRTTCG